MSPAREGNSYKWQRGVVIFSKIGYYIGSKLLGPKKKNECLVLV